MNTKNSVFATLIAAGIGLTGAGCNNSDNSPRPWDVQEQTNTVSPEQMLSTLVSMAQSGAIDPSFKGSYIAKLNAEKPGYFVIWDSARQAYVAVNLSCGNNCYDAKTIVKNFVAADAGQSGTFVTGTNLYNSYTNEWANNAAPFVSVAPVGVNQQGQTVYHDYTGGAYSASNQTKDVDLQRAQVQTEVHVEVAAAISAHFQMDFEHAAALATLADRVKQVSAGPGLSGDDRKAIMNAAFSIAGISETEVGQAISDEIRGNSATANQLLEKAAGNLGMPSSKALREQILPALGIRMN